MFIKRLPRRYYQQAAMVKVGFGYYKYLRCMAFFFFTRKCVRYIFAMLHDSAPCYQHAILSIILTRIASFVFNGYRKHSLWVIHHYASQNFGCYGRGVILTYHHSSLEYILVSHHRVLEPRCLFTRKYNSSGERFVIVFHYHKLGVGLIT